MTTSDKPSPDEPTRSDPVAEGPEISDELTGGRLAGLRWFLAFLGAGATSLLGLVTAFVAAMGCTDCSSNERKLQAAFALTALASGPAIGLVGLWAADRGWRPWLIWAGVVAASLIGVNNLLWSTSYGR